MHNRNNEQVTLTIDISPTVERLLTRFLDSLDTTMETKEIQREVDAVKDDLAQTNTDAQAAVDATKP